MNILTEIGPFMTVTPLLLVAVGGLGLMLADAFSQDKGGLAVLTATILGVAACISASLLIAGDQPALPEWVSAYISGDPMALFFDMVIDIGGALSALLAGGYLKEHLDERGEFYVLLLFSALGAMLLARAVDLLSIFVALETMSLGVYSLVAFRRSSARSAEAAIKYFLLGSFAAAILLFGSALLYGATGHTNLAKIGAVVSAGEADLPLMMLSLLLLFAGLAFKVSAVPFHMWTPDAYEGAPTPTTTFMAVAVKSAAFAVFVRVLLVAFGDELSMSPDSGWPPVLAALAAVTMIFGNLAALAQVSVKRMLAYSSIAHAGYIMVGMVASIELGSEALSAVFFYLLAYTVSNVLAFGALIWVGSYGREVVSYEDLAGVARRHPFVALPFVLGVLSLMGFPPTAGFFGKYYVFSAAVQAGHIWMAILGVLTSAIGAYYYLKVIVFMYMSEPKEGAPIAIPMRSGAVVAALAIAAFFVLEAGLTPSTYVGMTSCASIESSLGQNLPVSDRVREQCDALRQAFNAASAATAIK